MTVDENFKIDVFIDIRGLPCPIPSMKVRMQMAKMQPGAILKAITDAPHSRNSIPRFCNNFGHDLKLITEENGVYTFIIKKRSKDSTD
ncbi:MAG: sulfurtransferase TusA family protein [Asgard group archaeon]|nr:sulfurtransferase TusA family protein [Asgard group archaeon]